MYSTDGSIVYKYDFFLFHFVNDENDPVKCSKIAVL